MNTATIKKIIKNGGATLDASGRSVSFSSGYQVSRRDCYAIPVDKVNAITRAVVKLFKELNRGDFVGLWIDDGKIYIDISVHVKKREHAERLGRALLQISIRDWAMNDNYNL